jgi:isochorismate synthase
MMIYLAQIPGEGAWMGCTPEILVSGSGNHYRTMALAGTMSVPETMPVKNIVWSDKNRKEQEIVADYIRESITPYARIIEEEGPYTSRAGQLVHLKTEFHLAPMPSEMDHSIFNSKLSILNLIKALHPTPAVCGLPAEEAAAFIRENEGYDRSYYSGVVGMLDEEHETNLFVNLRCGHFLGDKTTLYAGGGILKDSNLGAEWNETNWKMNTILQTL